MADTACPGRELLHIQVCYAEAERQYLYELQVPPGTTLADAVGRCAVNAHLQDGKLENHSVGIYGKLKAPDTVLRERDRVEIYRPLQADPKEARRRRAEKKKAASPPK